MSTYSQYTVDNLPKYYRIHHQASQSITGLDWNIPMKELGALLEPSFADAIAAIEQASGLPHQTQRHWVCSLRQIAKFLDKPLEMIPARWTAVRFPIGRLHHARVGVTWKTLANHRANARAALGWLREEHDVPARGARLTHGWEVLWARLSDRRQRANLSSLMRYCSARHIAPEAVDETTFDACMAYRAESTALASDDAARRKIARTWNLCSEAIEGWPSFRPKEPPVKSSEGPSWGDFPGGLQNDVELYLQSLTRMRRSAKGRRIRPCKPSTIRTRRAELVAVARMAVRLGFPIENLTSLGALLDPNVAEKVLDAYWEQDGERPAIFTIELASKLSAAARQTGCLGEKALDRLDELRAELDHYRRRGLTDKNVALVRQVLSEGIWSEVVNLPRVLMAQARSERDHAPVKAAVTAQLAAAIAILTVAPVRLGNLASIRLGENLIKPGAPQSVFWLTFPDFDVKNRVRLEFPFDANLTALIDEYVHDFRPELHRGSNEPWLFPGETSGYKTPATLSDQVTKRIERATGLRITVHQFRHAAGALILKRYPGNYELVRRLLGHRNIQTTISFYCGLENTQASEIFAKIVHDHMSLAELDC